MLTWISLHVLIAVSAIIGTVPSHAAKDHLVWALQHQVKPCESDWRGITPTRELYAAYMSACTLLNSVALSDRDRAAVLINLRPRVPPGT